VRPQAHIASGLLLWGLSDAPAWEVPVAVAAANLPDFDRNVAKALGVQRRDHHRWVSHSFAGWIGPTLLLARSARGRRIAAGVWVHLLLDTYHDGLAWRWPLSEEKVGLFRRPPGIRDKGWQTPWSWSFEAGKVEAGLWAGAAIAALSRRSPRRARPGRSRRRRRWADRA